MKSRLYGIVLMFLSLSALAQERVYVTTDRDWYAAGETVYLSAFCADAGGALSPVSAVAYVELTSAGGLALTGKVALYEGRGAGSLQLPRSLPSGNYRLCAYTRLSSAPPMMGSRILSVYNTLSTARVPGGVSVGHLPEGAPSLPPLGDIRVNTLPDGRMSISCPKDATLSVSVFRNEPLPSYGSTTIAEALNAPAGQPVMPEYDGEILTLHLSGADGNPLTDREVLVSRPGHLEDLYAATVQDGTARVFTGNLFGTEDLVVTLGEDAAAFRVQVESPFRELSAQDIPTLMLHPTLSSALSRLGARMQVTRAFDADTLYVGLPVRRLDFAGEGRHYNLDDYTRFATMPEVLVEILSSSILTRGQGEDVELQVYYRTRQEGSLTYGDGASLILVDGVPVLDHSLVFQLDPALVKAVDVYPFSYALGKNIYRGLANFITFKEDMGGIRFGDNVRVLDFEGPAYPVAFTPSSDPGYPNQRETLLWQPLVNLKAGEEWALPALQADEGLVLVVEGLTADGSPVYFRSQ